MTRRGKTHPLVHTLAVLALVLVGPAAAADGGAATIEELIEQCKGKESFAELLPLVHPDDQPTMGLVIYMVASFAPMMVTQEGSPEEQEAASAKLEAEFEALDKKHGLREVPPIDDSMDTPDGMAIRARKVFEGVDIAAFVRDAESWVAGVAPETMGRVMPDFTQLENLQVDGDSATATLEGSPVEFIRIDGRWYLKLEM